MIMIQSILCIPEDKLSALKNVTHITAHERQILKDIVDILTPFQEATDFVQVDCVPSAGYVLLHVKALKSSLQQRMFDYESNNSPSNQPSPTMLSYIKHSIKATQTT